MAPIIKTTDLDKYFGRLYVLKNVSLEVAPKEVICLIGRSGSGKSTLLRCINFLEEPSDGMIEVDGLQIHPGIKGKQRRQIIHDIRLRTGMVFQEFNLFPHLTVVENVMEGPVTVKGMGKAQAIKIAEMNLERVGMIAKRDEYPNRLSGGQKQRVAIARAVANDGALLLADEATANLDSKQGLEIIKLLHSLAKQKNKCVIVASHDTRILEFADSVIRLEDGKNISSMAST